MTCSRHVTVLGLNHATSPVAVRDRLLFSRQRLEEALTALREVTSVEESVILSTCNRVEIYASTPDPQRARTDLLVFLSRFHGIAVEQFEPSTYFHRCHHAVEHLLAVTASLDSLVIGESQILGQVKSAYFAAVQRGTTGPALNKLFHCAMATGKRVRAETAISEGVVSIASVAVDLAGKILGRLDTSTALILGVGEMSKLTARSLQRAGLRRLYIANRTRENAEDLARDFGGNALDLDQWPAILSECDIVVSATGAPGYVIDARQVRQAMTRRKNRPVFLIDIAAPRDIEPETGSIYNVFLYTLDDLTAASADNTRMREREIDAARAIVHEEAQRFYDWYRTVRALPTVSALRRIFEQIRDDELKCIAPMLAGLPEPSQEAVRKITESLIDKFLHVPWRILREKSEDEQGRLLIEAFSEMLSSRRRM